MRLAVRIVIVLMTVVLCQYSYAGDIDKFIKMESGLSLSWKRTSNDVNASQVNIYDMQSHPLVTLNVLRVVPDAIGVTVYDVSARGNLIAVAAVYKSKEGNRKVRPAASLLLFNFQGELLSVLALSPTHTVSLLAIDDNSNVWTLTDGAGKEFDPSTVPMVVEYSSQGKIVRELLPRNTFPFHATDTMGDGTIGWASMGYDSGVVWFWLPGSTDLVTISTKDGESTVRKTGMPEKAGHTLSPVAVIREPSGNLLVQVTDLDSEGGFKAGHFTWSLSKRSWSYFTPSGCEGGRLIGISENQQVYLRFVSHTDHTAPPNLCIAGTPTPTLP